MYLGIYQSTMLSDLLVLMLAMAAGEDKVLTSSSWYDVLRYFVSSDISCLSRQIKVTYLDLG